MTTSTGNGTLAGDVFDFAIAQFDRREAADIGLIAATSNATQTALPSFLDVAIGTATVNYAAGDDSVIESTASTATESEAEAASRSYWTLLLLLFPLATAFGNVLVCLSVYSERSLRTVTNYFIVSLAVADIMVAVLVMPPAVYVEVNNADWELGDILCDTWVAFDVMSCTASILNLTAISVDRFTAVTRPITYARQKSSRRVYAMIAIPWIVSIAISSPIVLGLNYTEQRSETPTVCTFYNPDFLVYSSMGSFFIPSLVMTVLYGRIYLVIRSRSRGTAGGSGHVGGGKGGASNGRSPTEPSRYGGGGATTAWHPSAWSRAVESCNLATPSRVAAPPPTPPPLIPTTTATVGLPASTSIATVCGKVVPAIEHLSTDALTEPLSQPSADQPLPASTATSAINDDGRSRDRRCIVASSSDDSTTANDDDDDEEEDNEDDEGVINRLLPLMACPGSSTTTMMMIIGTPVDEDAGMAGDGELGGDAAVDEVTTGGAGNCRHVGFRDDALYSPTTATTEIVDRSACDLGMLTSPLVTLTLSALDRKDFATVALNPTTTSTMTMTMLCVPDTAVVGNGRLTAPNSFGRSENSPRLQMGGEVSVIDVDDWTIAAASVDADDGVDQATDGRPNEDGGCSISGQGSRLTRQASTNNHRFRAQHQHQQQQQQQQQQHPQQSASRTRNVNKLKRAARRERKATKTLAIVLGVFLFCWTPFFAINMVNAMCLRYNLVSDPTSSSLPSAVTALPDGDGYNTTGVTATDDDEGGRSTDRNDVSDGAKSAIEASSSSSSSSSDWSKLCDIEPWMFSFLVWLGYINSFLNPVIYTIFNAEFRRAFSKILHRRILRPFACRNVGSTRQRTDCCGRYPRVTGCCRGNDHPVRRATR